MNTELIPLLEREFGVSRDALAVEETPRFNFVFIQFPAGHPITLEALPQKLAGSEFRHADLVEARLSEGKRAI